MAGGNVGRGEDEKTLREYNSLHRPTKPNMLLNQSLTLTSLMPLIYSSAVL